MVPSPTSSAPGKVLYIGVSEWTAERDPGRRRAGPRAADPVRVEPAAVLHALAGHRGRGRAGVARGAGLVQIVWSPIAQGVLTGQVPARAAAARPGSRATDAARRRRLSSSGSWRDERARARSSALRPIAEGLGLTMAQLAVAWVLQNDNVAAAIIGASRPEQVHENVQASGVRLDPETMAAIDAALGRSRRQPTRPRRPARRPGRSDRRCPSVGREQAHRAVDLGPVVEQDDAGRHRRSSSSCQDSPIHDSASACVGKRPSAQPRRRPGSRPPRRRSARSSHDAANPSRGRPPGALGSAAAQQL